MSSITVGSDFPSGVKFPYVPYTPENSGVVACGIPTVYDVDKKLAGKKFVIVAVPGAFTPTCTANHIPPYIEQIKKLQDKGVEAVIVISANDPFVQSAWGKALGAKGEVIFATDPDAAFSKSLGLDLDMPNGFGHRTDRYALIADKGKIIYLEKESTPSDVTVSGVDAILAKL